MGNALSSNFHAPSESEVSDENLHKYTLFSNFMDVKDVDKYKKFFLRYTAVHEPFGSRSTRLYKALQQRKLPSYFSACLTLTTNVQGATLVKPTDIKHNKVEALNAMDYGYPRQSTTGEQKNKLIFIIDADYSLIPKDIRARHNHKLRFANIQRQFPVQNKSQYREYIGYAYRLVTQYAQDAKVVITARIQVGLPALALGVPVIFVNPEGCREETKIRDVWPV